MSTGDDELDWRNEYTRVINSTPLREALRHGSPEPNKTESVLDGFDESTPESGALLESSCINLSLRPSDRQIGGDHYKGFKIQPFKFFYANNIPFHKADIIKRILRYDLPTGKGKEDLEKIQHEIELIMEMMND